MTSFSDILRQIQASTDSLTPELRKAADFILENPAEVSMCSIRQLAARAEVKPNSLVRLSQALGMESYEAFRDVFRDEVRQGGESYPDRARWLQRQSKQGRLGALFGETAAAAAGNLDKLFAMTGHEEIEAAARAIVAARRTYVVGVGVNNPVAHGFAYLAGMAIDGVRPLPAGGMLPVDGLARVDERDVVIVMTFAPYRREAVQAAEVAAARDARIIAVSDALQSPIMEAATHRFIAPVETPHFFASTIALTAFFEVLAAFVVATSGGAAVESIRNYHRRRSALGVYVDESFER